jgi:hypothetical protein
MYMNRRIGRLDNTKLANIKCHGLEKDVRGLSRYRVRYPELRFNSKHASREGKKQAKVGSIPSGCSCKHQQLGRCRAKVTAKSLEENCMGYRSYWSTCQAKYGKKDEKGNIRLPAHDSGSVTSSMLGGGMNPCDAAASMRAAFATWGSPMPPCDGDLLLAGAIAEGIAEL